LCNFIFLGTVAIFVGPVAQSVEQRIENPCVGGSIPPRATKRIKQSAQLLAWLTAFLPNVFLPITSKKQKNLHRKATKHNGRLVLFAQHSGQSNFTAVAGVCARNRKLSAGGSRKIDVPGICQAGYALGMAH
jgi:hypothetical protein